MLVASTSGAGTICLRALALGARTHTLEEARVLVEGWRQQYNTLRPHSALGYQPPAPEAFSWPTDAVLLGAAGPIAPLVDLA